MPYLVCLHAFVVCPSVFFLLSSVFSFVVHLLHLAQLQHVLTGNTCSCYLPVTLQDFPFLFFPRLLCLCRGSRSVSLFSLCQDTYVLSSSSFAVQIHQLRLRSGPHLLSFSFLVSRYRDTPLPYLLLLRSEKKAPKVALAFHQQVLTLRRGHGSSRNSVV